MTQQILFLIVVLIEPIMPVNTEIKQNDFEKYNQNKEQDKIKN